MIRSRRLLALTLLFAGAGCYASQPVSMGVAPETGTRLDVKLSDAGRVALGPAIGPEVDRIDGTLLEQDSTGMTLAVKHLIGLNGSVQVWSDELVRVQSSHVAILSKRRFSSAKTAALGAASVGGFVFLASRGLLPFGFEPGDGDGGSTDTTGNSIIRLIRRP